MFGSSGGVNLHRGLPRSGLESPAEPPKRVSGASVNSPERLGDGQRALQGGTVVRPAVRRQRVLDRQLEQRTQQRYRPLTRDPLRLQPARVELEASAEVDQRVTRNDRASAL